MPAQHDSLFIRRNQCPGCSSDNLTSIYKRSYEDPHMKSYMELSYQGNVEYTYLEGVYYEIVECSSCRLMFQVNVLNDTGTQLLYDVWINPDLAEKWHQEAVSDQHIDRNILKYVRRYLRRPDMKMLDYGAGFGDFCLLGKEYGFDVSALEFSKERAASLEEKGIQPVMPGEERMGHYDFISLDQVLEHLADPLNTLKNIRHALRDDGLVFLSVPNCRRLKNSLMNVDSLPPPQFKTALLDCSALQHINCFTEHSLRSICEKAGFRNIFHPLQFIACSKFTASPKKLAKNLIRPFYYRTGTAFFLQKIN